MVFFVKDRIYSGNMSIAHCSPEHMLVNFFTTFLQGDMFVNFREVIMGWKHIDALKMGPPSTKECVVNVDEFNTIIYAKKK